MISAFSTGASSRPHGDGPALEMRRRDRTGTTRAERGLLHGYWLLSGGSFQEASTGGRRVDPVAQHGLVVPAERHQDVARLSPFVRHRVTVLGRHSFQLPEMPCGLRLLRAPVREGA
ncbi:hypothetical protein ACFVZD_13375 [Streptomyces sp. NPDC058287]|uniref:hypothetical protein n=1 Tax=unclassified Streptomyces TaxID=2593676 RepID=UPI0036E3595D